MQKEYSYERYQRQIILKNFGDAGQLKLTQAKVLVVGAGGLGCPAMLYLAAAGVGTIGVVDDDVVELGNLHRQPLFTTDDIGKSKATTAGAYLEKLNPDISIIPYIKRLLSANSPEIVGEYDIIIDATDNFASRYMINDLCVLLNKPLIFGAVSQYEGQLAVFNVRRKDEKLGMHYRDLFPFPPDPGEVLSCAEAGVLGVLPGIVGTMQAAEAIKLITGIGQPLVNKLYTFNVLNNQSLELELQKRKDSDILVPGTIETFRQTDYDWLCGKINNPFEISTDQFLTMLDDDNIEIIDVREPDEMPQVLGFNYKKIPLSKLEESINRYEKEMVIFFCQSGVRSIKAAQWLQARNGNNKTIFSLQGGILNYIKQRQEQKL